MKDLNFHALILDNTSDIPASWIPIGPPCILTLW